MTQIEQVEEVKFRSGQFLIPGQVIYGVDGRIYLKFKFNQTVKDEVKSMAEAKWHGHDKPNLKPLWSVADNPRNRFQLDWLTGGEPYAPYDQPLFDLPNQNRLNRKLMREITPYAHQHEMFRFILTRRCCIIAGEMGVGKTLPVIMAMDFAAKAHGWTKEGDPVNDDFWYVAPKSVIKAIERELIIWGAEVRPYLLTYEKLVSIMRQWEPGRKAPKWVTFDECSRLKNHTSQRSQAALALANGVRDDWGDRGYVIEMSGTPAPKSPEDWWHQCEVACPGFLKEGDIYKFRRRLGIIKQVENKITGGVFPQLVTWRDNPDKCQVCGQPQDHPNHVEAGNVFDVDPPHDFQESKNEVEGLYRRLQGLVLVKFKKDCLDLPEKQYRLIEVKPSPSILRAAKLLTKSSRTVIEGLTRLRELSDGFQYNETKIGTKVCSLCHGEKKIVDFTEVPDTCPNCPGAGDERCLNHVPKYVEAMIECPNCRGSGEEDKYERTATRVACPKDAVIIDLLDENEDIGRIVLYAGFQEAVDRVVDVCHRQGWATIRADGRGILIQDVDGRVLPVKNELSVFQDLLTDYPKVAWCAHPTSGGIGTTLTAASMEVYFSNDHNGESRTQSEDRIHRPGMDLNRGATIVDIIHLPSDLKVLTNLKAKRRLEKMSMGELSEALEDQGQGPRLI